MTDGAPQNSNDWLSMASAKVEKIDKIWGFAGKVASAAVVILTLIYQWLGEQAVVWPRRWLVLGIVAVTVGGVALWVLAARRRTRWGKLKVLVAAIAGAVCVGLAAMVGVLLPPLPVWQRISIPELQSQSPSGEDLAIAVMHDQLYFTDGSIPGGPTYKHLLDEKRQRQGVQEQWAGYYAPVLVPNTMPRRLALRNGSGLQNASLGVIAIVWSERANGQVVVFPPKEFGYTSLRQSVDIALDLEASQRASMFVFVYPLTAKASGSLADRLEDVVDVQ